MNNMSKTEEDRLIAQATAILYHLSSLRRPPHQRIPRTLPIPHHAPRPNRHRRAKLLGCLRGLGQPPAHHPSKHNQSQKTSANPPASNNITAHPRPYLCVCSLIRRIFVLHTITLPNSSPNLLRHYNFLTNHK